MSISLSSLTGGSGIDTSTIIEQMLATEYQRLEEYTFKKEVIDAKTEAWLDIGTQLSTFASAIQEFKGDYPESTTIFDNKVTNLSNENVVTVAASKQAMTGSYSIKVDQISQPQVIYGFKDPDLSTITTSETITLNGASISISAGDSLEDIVATINNASDYDSGHELTALIIDSRLVLQTLSGAGHSIYGENGVFSSSTALEALGIINLTSTTEAVADGESAVSFQETVTFSITSSVSFSLNGATIDVDIDDTLETIAYTINNASDFDTGEEVSATTFTDSLGNENISLQTIDSTIAVDITVDTGSTHPFTGMTSYTGYGTHSEGVAQYSQNLKATINGVPIEESTNVSEAIENTLLSFHSTGDTTLSIQYDYDNTTNRIIELVDLYNETRDQIANYQKVKVDEKDTFGVFANDREMISLYNNLRSEIYSQTTMGDAELWQENIILKNNAKEGDSLITIEGIDQAFTISDNTYIKINNTSYKVKSITSGTTSGEFILSLEPPLTEDLEIWSEDLETGTSIQLDKLHLEQIGILVDRNDNNGLTGRLVVDESTLRSQIITDITKVEALFNRFSSSSATDSSETGLAHRLYEFIDTYTKVSYDSSIHRTIDDMKINEYEADILRIENQIEDQQEKIEKKKQRLSKDFAKMEQVIRLAEAKKDQLSAMLGNSNED